MHTLNLDLSSNDILSFLVTTHHTPCALNMMTETRERVETKKTICRCRLDERFIIGTKVSFEPDMLTYYVNKQRTKYKHLKHPTRGVWRNLSVWTEGRTRVPGAASAPTQPAIAPAIWP
jgi:hypothetical protein